MTDVLTFHNDVARTGQATNEQILTPSNVNTNHFGKLWMLPTDEKIFAQPLYVAGVSIPGKGRHNVLFVATENDSVYAYDADSTNLFWQSSLVGRNEEPYQISTCTITPQLGVTATPVIDRNAGPHGTIFVQCMSQDASTNAHQRLHALDLSTGQDRITPAEIAATYPGTGDNSTNGTVYFVPADLYDRACLLLVNGVVYTAWSAHCNSRPSGSWIIGYYENTLTQAGVIAMEPNSYWGSIWNSGAGPSADTNGNIYVVTGDGAFQDWEAGVNAGGFPNDSDYGNAMVKLCPTNNSLVVTDYFTEYNAVFEDDEDWDLGAGAALVLPDMIDGLGNTRHLVAVAGKDQNLYIADRSNMGKYNPANNNALYQELTNVFVDTNNDDPNNEGMTGGIWSIGAYFNGTVYYGPVRGYVLAFSFTNAVLGGPVLRNLPQPTATRALLRAFQPMARPTVLSGHQS